MDTLAHEIQRLKEELDRKRDEIVDLHKLIGETVDRKFPSSPEEFSDRELEIHLRDSLAALEGREETKPDLKAVLSEDAPQARGIPQARIAANHVRKPQRFPG
jgi:hypothetical protein